MTISQRASLKSQTTRNCYKVANQNHRFDLPLTRSVEANPSIEISELSSTIARLSLLSGNVKYFVLWSGRLIACEMSNRQEHN